VLPAIPTRQPPNRSFAIFGPVVFPASSGVAMNPVIRPVDQ
jgi:hypothetical protein